MRILLMVPPYIDKKDVPGSRFDTKIEDLGIEYISSFLKINGYPETILLHCQLDDVSCDDLESILIDIKPDIVGLSISFESTDYIGGIESAKLIKKLYPNTKVFAGGHAATFLHERLMEDCIYIDYIVLGEGELTTLALIDCLKNVQSIENVKGIIYRSGSSLSYTQKRQLIADLNSLPFADRSVYSKHKPEYALIESSRGCWGKCNFCSVPAFFGHGIGKMWRSRSAKNIVDEVEQVVNNWGVLKFDFVDDNFLGFGEIAEEKIFEFYELVKMKNLKIEFNIACRVESVNLSQLLLLREIGLKKVYIGIESGSNITLKRYGKNTSKEDNKKAINIIKQLDIEAKLCLIMFDPWTTMKELNETIDFIINMECYQYFHWTSVLNSYKPYVGTMMHKKLLNEFNEYSTLDQTKNFAYKIYDEKVSEIRTICRYISGAVKYFFEAIKDSHEIKSAFINLDLFLSEPLVKYIKYLLNQDVGKLKDNYCYLRIFYHILYHYIQTTMGGNIYERIEKHLYNTL